MAGKRFKPREFDVRIGQIIALTRNRFGMTQKDLATSLGVSFQQIQKYETGGNRMSVGALYEIARCFEMSVGELIDGATREYMNDTDITKLIDMMYKMDKNGRRFVLQAAAYVATPSRGEPIIF